MAVFGHELNKAEQAATGFASPAQGYEGERPDFNRLLYQNAPATAVFRRPSSLGRSPPTWKRRVLWKKVILFWTVP
jgi:hypothetical protein